MEDYKIYTSSKGLQEFNKAVEQQITQSKLGQGLHEQLEQSNILPYHSLKTIDVEDYINNMFGISNSNNSDPLWLEYKEENDPKLNSTRYISGSDYYGLKTSSVVIKDPSRASFINTNEKL